MNKTLINKFCRKFGFEVHGLGFIQSLKKSSFKDDAFARQKELVKSTSPLILDIGANRGDVSDRYLNLFPEARIHAFEPFPDIYDLLKQRFEANSHVHCHALAIADVEGQKEFYVNNNVDTNSLLKPRKTGLSSDAQVENNRLIRVPSTTLDKFASENSIKSIDILKMDIQGGELAALKGAQQLLENRGISCIYTEAYFIEQYEAQPLFHDISKFLYAYDFTLQDIYTPIYGKGNMAWSDAIFVLKGK